MSDPRNAYSTSDLNSILFNARKSWNDFYRSEKWFYENSRLLENVSSILDVGGGTGGLGNALSEQFNLQLDYTCIDPDPQCFELGKVEYPNFKHICGYFPEDLRNHERRYDLVVMQALFPQLTDWKSVLISMAEASKRFVTFSCRLRCEGTTVVDPDVSYTYYLDSGKRVPQVIHNIYELKNFLSIHEIGAKKIQFYGYNVPTAGNSRRCVALSKEIQGNILIERFSDDELGSIRYIGAQTDEKFHSVGASGFIGPEIEFVINDETFTDW